MYIFTFGVLICNQISDLRNPGEFKTLEKKFRVSTLTLKKAAFIPKKIQEANIKKNQGGCYPIFSECIQTFVVKPEY